MHGPTGELIASTDIEAIERIGVIVAKQFSMKKSPPLPPDLVEHDVARGNRALFEYTLDDGGRVIILHATEWLSGSHVSIGFLELRRSNETKLGSAIRARLEELLHREFPDRQIETLVGPMDTSFAP